MMTSKSGVRRLRSCWNRGNYMPFIHFACGLKLRSKGTSVNIVLYIYFDARSLKRTAEVKYLQTYGLPEIFNLRNNESKPDFGYEETIAILRVATGNLGFGPKC